MATNYPIVRLISEDGRVHYCRAFGHSTMAVATRHRLVHTSFTGRSASPHGRLAAAGEWVLNEKRITERAGLHAVQDRLAHPEQDLGRLVSDVRACLELTDAVW